MKRKLSLILSIVIIFGLSSEILFMNVTAAQSIEPSFIYGKEMLNQQGYMHPVEYNGKIYVFGGINKLNNGNHGNATPIKTSQAYDIATGTWEMIADMPTARSNAGTCVYNDKIYVIGGFALGKQINVVEVYDPLTNTWDTEPKATMPHGGNGYSIINISDKILVFAPYQVTTGNYDMNVYEYDVTNDRWATKGQKCPGGNGVINIVPYDHRIFIINTAGNNIYEYDYENDAYYLLDAKLPSSLIGTRFCGFIGDNAYFYNPNTGVISEVNMFTSAVNDFSSGFIFQYGFGNIVNYHGKLYFIGGSADASSNNMSKRLGIFTPGSVNLLTILMDVNEEIQLSVAKNLGDNIKMTWTEMEPSIATVGPSGVVTAHSVGITQIYTESADGTYRDFVNVEVLEGADDYRLALDLEVGESQRLRFSYDPAETWYSHDAAKVAVNSSGVVTAVEEGLVLIEAEYNGETGYIYVRVRSS